MTQSNCTLANVGDAVYNFSYPNLRLRPAPFAEDGRPVVVFGPGLFDENPEPSDFTIPGGRVAQTFDRNTFTIVNTTLQDHVFCCGTTTRLPVLIGNRIYVKTVGVGTHGLTGIAFIDKTLRLLNQRQGPIIFRSLDVQAKSYFDRRYGDP